MATFFCLFLESILRMGQGATKEEGQEDSNTKHVKKRLHDRVVGRKINISLFDHTPLTTARVYCLTTLLAIQNNSTTHNVDFLSFSVSRGHVCFDLVPSKLKMSIAAVRKQLDQYQKSAEGEPAFKLLHQEGGRPVAWFNSGEHASVAKLIEGSVGRAPGWVTACKDSKCECLPLKCNGVWVLPDLQSEFCSRSEFTCQPQFIVFEVEFLGECSSGPQPRLLAFWTLCQSQLWQQLPRELIAHILTFLPVNKPNPTAHSCTKLANYWKERNAGNQSVFICLAYLGTHVSVRTNPPQDNYYW